MTTATQNAELTATDHVRAAIRFFEVNGDGYRQSFKDRLIEVSHEWMRCPAAIDDLVGYANAISKTAKNNQAEFAVHIAFVESLKAIAHEMREDHREELKGIAQDRLQSLDKTDSRFYYFKTLRNELSR